MPFDGAEHRHERQRELPRAVAGHHEKRLGARARHHAIVETQRLRDRSCRQVLVERQRLAQQRERIGLRVGALRDAQLAEILAQRAGRAHVVLGQECETRVRSARAVGIDRIARKLAETRDRLPERVDVVRIGGDARDDLGIASLDRARGATQRDDAAGTTHGDVVEPARHEPEMLHQPDGGVGKERETRDARAVDLGLRDPGFLEQRGQRARDEPVRAAYRVLDVRHRDRHGHGHASVILTARDGSAHALSRRLSARTSRQAPRASNSAACSLSRALWIFSVGVRGNAGTTAT